MSGTSFKDSGPSTLDEAESEEVDVRGASFSDQTESESCFGAVSDNEVVVGGGSGDESQTVVGDDEMIDVCWSV